MSAKSFPLDGSYGLWRQVHQHTVDAVDLVGDPVYDLMQNGIRDLFYGGSHSVGGVDCTNNSGPAFVAAFILHTDTLNVRHDDKVLPDLFAQTALIKFLPENGIGFPQCVQTVTGNGTQAAHAQTGTGEG